MFSSEVTYSPVPAFLSKLWSLVEDPSTNELICWDASGKSFHILDQSRFAREILPLYFKHNNIASFIRQLNMYGFRKVINNEALNVKTEKDDMEFSHLCFVQDQEHLLVYIKRKVPGTKTEESGGHGLPREGLKEVINEISSMKYKQDSVTQEFDQLKNVNDVLWREVIHLRQEHIKQKKIVEPLVHFLYSLVGSERPQGALKRKLPLMLESSAQNDGNPPSKILNLGNIGSKPQSVVHPASRARSDDLSSGSSQSSYTVQHSAPSTHQIVELNDQMEPLVVLDATTPTTLELTDLLNTEENEEETGLFNMDSPLCQLDEDEQDPLDMVASFLNTPKPRFSNDDQSEIVTTVARSEPKITEINFDQDEMSTKLQALQNNIGKLQGLLAGKYKIDQPTLELIYSDVPLFTNPNLSLTPEESENDFASNLFSKSKVEPNGTLVGTELITWAPPEDFSKQWSLTGDDDYSSLFCLGDDNTTLAVDPSTLTTDEDNLEETFPPNTLELNYSELQTNDDRKN